MPKPANWRIVQSRPRYIDSYGPRVNGYSPGSPIVASGSAGACSGPYSGAIGCPDIVENSASRCLSSGLAPGSAAIVTG